jgi:hypothetical protein
MRTKSLFQPFQQFKQFNSSLHNNESGLKRFERFERLEPFSVLLHSNAPFLPSEIALACGTPP